MPRDGPRPHRLLRALRVVGVTALRALIVGLAFGGGTKLLHLPLPAPSAFAGVVCIAGVYLGAFLVGGLK